MAKVAHPVVDCSTCAGACGQINTSSEEYISS